MFLDKNSLKVKIGNQEYVNLGQYITSVEYQYNKLWGSDSGRNLAGEQSGTLLGIFPKLVVSFRKLTKSEIEILTPILDSAYQKVSYYDPYKKTTVEMDTYTGDYSYTNNTRIGNDRKNSDFQISFISIRARA